LARTQGQYGNLHNQKLGNDNMKKSKAIEFDLEEEVFNIIKVQQELIEKQERDNLYLVIALVATVVLMFLDAAWR